MDNNNNKPSAGPGKKKPKRRNRPKRRIHQRPRGPPTAPQTKVVLRNLGLNCNISFTVKEMIRRTNERLNEDGKIELNEQAFEDLLQLEDGARVAREDERAKLQERAQRKEGKEEEVVVEESEPAEQMPESTTQQQQHDDAVANEPAELPLQVDVTPVSPESGIAARVLYTVPPKKTRRRGDKPGCVYIMLTTSRIEAREADAVSQSSQPSNRSVIDYSRDIAERRLILHKALQAVAIEDAKSKQEFAGCVVLEAPNSKTWKPFTISANNNSNTRNRLEGTIFQSPDYLEFLELSERQKQERMARPKPMPGGGVLISHSATLISENNSGDNSATTNLATTTGNNEGPVAAIVLHLRAKQEAEKRRKQAKRRTAKKGTANAKKDTDAASGREAKASKQKKKSKKSKKKTMTVSPNVTNVLK